MLTPLVEVVIDGKSVEELVAEATRLLASIGCRVQKCTETVCEARCSEEAEESLRDLEWPFGFHLRREPGALLVLLYLVPP